MSDFSFRTTPPSSEVGGSKSGFHHHKEEEEEEAREREREQHLSWGFSQVFGERAPNEEVQDADIISAVEFDRTGDWLATGDRGGRVVLFERVRQNKRTGRQHPEDELEDVLMEEMSSEMQYNRDDQVGVMINNNNNSASTSEINKIRNGQEQLLQHLTMDDAGDKPEQVEFRYLTEFQSHEPEFDYLKSLEIEEKINTLKWCHQGANEGGLCCPRTIRRSSYGRCSRRGRRR